MPGGASAADSPSPTVPGAPGNQPRRQLAQKLRLPIKATLWHPVVLQVSPLGTAHRTAAALTPRNAASRSIAMTSVIRARCDEIVFSLTASQSGVSQVAKWSRGKHAVAQADTQAAKWSSGKQAGTPRRHPAPPRAAPPASTLPLRAEARLPAAREEA